MRVLILGGTSFFGKLIGRGFLDRGDQVSVYTRGRRRPDFLDVVEHLRGDRTDHAGFVRALSDRSFDVVVDNIAFLRPDVEAAVRAFGARIGHYLLTSSGSVYPRFAARAPFQPIVEEAADLTLRGDDDYSEGKRACEQAALEQNLFPVTIIRPPIVQGPEDPSRRGWFWYQRIADGGPVLVPLRSPSSVWRQACSRDIAAAVLLAGILEKGDPVVSVPAEVLGRDAPWYRPTFAHWFVMDTTKIKADLGFAPVPLPQWLAETVRWHLAAALPPAEGYDRRGDEIALARRAQAAPQDA